MRMIIQVRDKQIVDIVCRVVMFAEIEMHTKKRGSYLSNDQRIIIHV